MKHKILICLDEHTSGPEVFAELKGLLNESHEKVLTGIRLQDYLERSLQPANGLKEIQSPNGQSMEKKVRFLQYTVDMEHAAEQHDMDFKMHRGELTQDSIKNQSAVADLMIIDRKVLKPYCGQDILSDLVADLLCPVLVLPPRRSIESLVMVYDGSYASIQVVKSFVAIFNPTLRALPFYVLVVDPESQRAMEQERVLIDYLKLFFDDMGVQLMDDSTLNCLTRNIDSVSEKPLLLLGGFTGQDALNCQSQNRHITDNHPTFIFKNISE